MEKATKTAEVVKLKRFAFSRPFDVSGLPERELPTAPDRTTGDEMLASTDIDLSGRLKAIFAISRGRSGKTTLLRVIGELSDERGAQMVVAAADPVNRSLKAFRSDVAEPPTNDPDEVATWLQSLIAFTIAEKANALIDLGGGDTSMSRLLKVMPDLVSVMQGEGVEPVALYVIGPDEHDLVPLAQMTAAGFIPQATAIVRNEALGTRPEFARVMAHSVYQEAVRRGAVQLWMPRLLPAAMRMVDARGLSFAKAGGELGLINGAPVRVWLGEMRRQLGPIARWLP